MIYGVISDTHCHNWSTFSETEDDYINSRLKIILSEIERAAKEVADKGGQFLLHAGDLFHVRGNIPPSVLNPTIETFKRVKEMGVIPVIICGNHDAEFRVTNEVGSAVSALSPIAMILNSPKTFTLGNEYFCFMPWIQDTNVFYEEFEKAVEESKGEPLTLICHAALDGVFSHISPSTIIDHKKLFAACPNLKFVFAGHLHDHKKIDKNCYSVGAIAQHTWGESSAKAGFLIVDSDKNKVTFRASRAPKFVELTSSTNAEDIPALVEGNYVRATVEMNESEIKDFRKYLEDLGAVGVSIVANVKPIERKEKIPVDTTRPLTSIVGDYIGKKYASPQKEQLQTEADRIMSEV